MKKTAQTLILSFGVLAVFFVAYTSAPEALAYSKNIGCADVTSAVGASCNSDIFSFSAGSNRIFVETGITFIEGNTYYLNFVFNKTSGGNNWQVQTSNGSSANQTVFSGGTSGLPFTAVDFAFVADSSSNGVSQFRLFNSLSGFPVGTASAFCITDTIGGCSEVESFNLSTSSALAYLQSDFIGSIDSFLISLLPIILYILIPLIFLYTAVYIFKKWITGHPF